MPGILHRLWHLLAEGSLQLTALKTVNGEVPEEGRVYEFVLEGENVSLTATNEGENVVFDEIRYELADAGKTYTYTIRETTESAGNMTADATVYTVEVTVIDNGDGTWKVTVESGLEPMNYTLHIKPIPAEGHCLIFDEYNTFDMKIGLPQTWWLYHDSFGNPSSCDPIEGTDDYIIDFSPGKVRFHKNLNRH